MHLKCEISKCNQKKRFYYFKWAHILVSLTILDYWIIHGECCWKRFRWLLDRLISFNAHFPLSNWNEKLPPSRFASSNLLSFCNPFISFFYSKKIQITWLFIVWLIYFHRGHFEAIFFLLLRFVCCFSS